MDPKLIQSYLDTLSLDIEAFKESLFEVSQDIIHGKFSKFPIFVAHQELVSLGEIILDHRETGGHFTIQASTLEEFIEKKIILESKADSFKASYKNPLTHFCFFLVTPYGATYVFIPHKLKGNSIYTNG